jgi:di/tripeptidase
MRQSDRAKGVDRDRLLQTFLDLVAIDTPTGHEEEIAKDLEARFDELGCTVSRDEIEKGGECSGAPAPADGRASVTASTSRVTTRRR